MGFLEFDQYGMSAFNDDYIKYLTIPYKHLGRTFEGCDCLGLVKLFYKEELGIDILDFQKYEEFWHCSTDDFFVSMHQMFGMHCIEHPAFGDVIFILTGNKITHCGVVVNVREGYFLHMTRRGPALHTYKYGQWAERLSGFYRYQGQCNDYQG